MSTVMAGPPVLGWRRLRRVELFVVAVTLILVAVVALPSLPPGICFGDSGELQLVACVLGITHAPGYPIYASLGHPLTYVPGVDPGYVISLACLGSGLVVLWLCLLTQLRLGVEVCTAGALTLLLVGHARTWVNLVAPEVYMPTLALQAGSVYLLIKYSRLGRRRDLLWSVVLFGAALANRPPVLLTLPFLLLAWWVAHRRWESARLRDIARSFGVCTLFAAMPGLYALGYLYVRDTRSNPYDYIELHDREYDRVPDVDVGVGAKLHRVFWHASAREFDYAKGNDWRGVWTKLRWFSREFFLYEPTAFFASALYVLVGAFLVYKRDPTAFWLLVGMIVASVVFICSYRMWGQAADYMPLMWASIVLLGVATIPLARIGRGDTFRRLALAAWVVLGIATVGGGFARPRAALAGDALPYVREMDMSTLPENAVVCVAWPETPVVFYERYITTRRTDITIVAAATKNWERMLEPYAGRLIFAASHNPELTRFRLVPFRNIWRLDPIEPASAR